jgi:hypothetical protein
MGKNWEKGHPEPEYQESGTMVAAPPRDPDPPERSGPMEIIDKHLPAGVHDADSLHTKVRNALIELFAAK